MIEWLLSVFAAPSMSPGRARVPGRGAVPVLFPQVVLAVPPPVTIFTGAAPPRRVPGWLRPRVRSALLAVGFGPATTRPPRERAELSLGRHLRSLVYSSFRHAQGSQATQVHFIQSYVRFLREQGVPFDPAAGPTPAEHLDRLRLPAGHVDVPDGRLIRAQFEFWAHTLWDITRSIYAGNPALLPDRAGLADRAAAVGATEGMSSFTDAEMASLAEALETYRTPAAHRLDGAGVARHLLVPSLLEVELRFQGTGERYPSRPRTDGGDVHESRLRGQCEQAAERYRTGRQDTANRVYRAVCGRLEELTTPAAAGTPEATRYRLLIAAYNGCHPAAEVARLHVPPAGFP